MATTINGFIAKNDDSSAFLTKEESASYVNAIKNAGALIIGRRTYEILSKQPEFQEFLKAGVKIVAVSSSNFKVLSSTHSVASSPQEALKILKDFKEIVVAGGSKLNASFLKENLIDEIYIDIEPTVLGKGIPLLRDSDIEKNLKFLGLKYITENEIQLHYKVLK